MVEKLLETYPVKIQLQVAWGEMDAFGHVNNTVYFRYFESARIKYFDELPLKGLQKEANVGPILAQTACQFKKALTYPDTIWVGVKVVSMGNSSFVMEHKIVSEKIGEAATGQGVVVMFNYKTGQKAAISDEMRTAIEAFEQNTDV